MRLDRGTSRTVRGQVLQSDIGQPAFGQFLEATRSFLAS
jgi:hypothetical protein